MLVFFTKSCEISGQAFAAVLSFNKQPLVVLNGRNLPEYPVSAGVPQGFTFGPTLLLLYTNDLSDEVICNTYIYAQSFPQYRSRRWEREGIL